MSLASTLDVPRPTPGATPPPLGAARTGASAAALPIFAALWAIATLFHHAAYPRSAFAPVALLVTLPAVWLLLRPRAPGRLVLLAGAQLLQVAWLGPSWVSNHWLLTAAVNLAIVGAALWLALGTRRGGGGVGTGGPPRLDGGALFAAFAPAARLTLLVLYFYGVFQKLNTDYLDPASSCATWQYGQILAKYPFLPSGAWMGYLAIYGTLVIEALIAVLLVVRRTRVAGVLLGGVFHAMLALNPSWVFYDFTSALLALYFLFVPLDYLAERRAGGAGVAPGWLRRGARGARAALVVLALGLAAAAALGVRPSTPFHVNALQEAARVAFFAYFAVLLAVFGGAARRTDVAARTAALVRFVPRPALLALAPLLFFANGLAPYVGLKTEASIAMFSNLRTEQGRTNHLLMGWVPRVAGYQDDVVRVIASTDSELARFGRRGLLLPYYEFQARAARHPGASVTYERNGRRFAVARIGDDPALGAPPPRWQRAYLRFRAFEPWDVPQRCRH